MTKNKLSKAIVIFNLVVTPLIFLPNQIAFDYFYFPKYVVLMISSLLLLIPLWLNRQNLRQLLVWDTINKLLVIYMIYLSISVCFAIDPALAINGSYWRMEGLSTILFYVMLFMAARSIGQLDKKFYAAMLVTAVIISMYGTAQYFGFDLFQREYFRLPYVPISTIGNQNFIGSYFVLIIPLSLNFWIIEKKKVALVAYSILLFGLMTTMSRGPWLGYAAALITYLILDGKLHHKSFFAKENLVLLGVTFAVILVFALTSDGVFIARLLSIFYDFNEIIRNSPGSEDTGSGRWFIWQKTLVLVMERPWFGVGIENLGLVFPGRFANEMFQKYNLVVYIDRAHNEYLDMMVSSGIPSLLIYLSFLFSILKMGFRKLTDDPMKIALMSSLIGYLVQAFFNIRVVSVAYIFWIFLALILNSPAKSSTVTTQ